MNPQDRFDRILTSVHDAAFDDLLWPAASALIDEACGSKGNCLVSGDGASPDRVVIFFARFCYRGQLHPEWQREYFEVHASSLYTEEEKKTSAAWNDALFRSDTRDSLNVRLDGPEGSRIVWVPIAVATGRGRHSTLLAFTLRHAVSSALCAPLSARDRPS